MSLYDETSKGIYDHYSTIKWLDETERIKLGTAFRIVHGLAVMLSRLDLSAKSLPVSTFSRDTGIDALANGGYQLHTEARIALDSTVGNLLGLVDVLENYQDNAESPRLLNYEDIILIGPENRQVIGGADVPSEWMDVIRTLRTAFATWDDAACKLPDDHTNIMALCYHAYRITMTLHEGLTTLRLAQLQNERTEQAK